MIESFTGSSPAPAQDLASAGMREVSWASVMPSLSFGSGASVSRQTKDEKESAVGRCGPGHDTIDLAPVSRREGTCGISGRVPSPIRHVAAKQIWK